MMDETTALSVDMFDLDLDVYQGPFDLLFTLILREEVDIFEISVLDIILAWMERRASAGETDWEALSEFLVLVSALLEWKSRTLLPDCEPADDELDPEEAREQLLARLIRYHSFKGAGESLQNRLERQHGRRSRPADRRSGYRLKPVDEIKGEGNSRDLAAKLQGLLEARRPPDITHLPPAHVPLSERLATIRRLLSRLGSFSFDETFGKEGAMVQAVTLFALLELLSRGRIDAHQKGPFADIRIEAREARSIA